MAVDEVLLTSAIDLGGLTVRIYQWDEPTVSLGHFQSPQAPVLTDRFGSLPRVRRLSGGGAILHDREVTYSCVIPRSHPLAQNPVRLYEVVHEAIIALLNEYEIDATMRGEAKQEPEPFLCFGRGDPRDIVLGKDKIVGSAQRRRSGAVLQHGAILVAASPHAPEFPGIADLTGQQLDPSALSTALGTRIYSALTGRNATGIEPSQLTAEENDLADEWARQRYAIGAAPASEVDSGG